jgi:CRISPR system Cascade subunit CasD
MREFLLFHLYGPMASWGGPAVGEHRHSDGHPGRSAILGLLAAGLGLRRDQEAAHTALEASYGIGVRIDCDGELMRDYHTVQAPARDKKAVWASRYDEIHRDPARLSTLLSQRDYRVEAAYTVALWPRVESPPYALADLAEALNHPRFTLYLGRKSCPLGLPVAARVVAAANLGELFAGQEWPWKQLFEHLPLSDNPRCYWDEMEDAGMQARLSVPRRDSLISRKRWQFAERQEYMGRLPEKGGK